MIASLLLAAWLPLPSCSLVICLVALSRFLGGQVFG